MEEVFAQMDADYSGYLSRDEIGDLLEQVRENERNTSRFHTRKRSEVPKTGSGQTFRVRLTKRETVLSQVYGSIVDDNDKPSEYIGACFACGVVLLMWRPKRIWRYVVLFCALQEVRSLHTTSAARRRSWWCGWTRYEELTHSFLFLFFFFFLFFLFLFFLFFFFLFVLSFMWFLTLLGISNST